MYIHFNNDLLTVHGCLVATGMIASACPGRFQLTVPVVWFNFYRRLLNIRRGRALQAAEANCFYEAVLFYFLQSCRKLRSKSFFTVRAACFRGWTYGFSKGRWIHQAGAPTDAKHVIFQREDPGTKPVKTLVLISCVSAVKVGKIWIKRAMKLPL